MIENTTPNRHYQLPNGVNYLSDDVARLVMALMAIDVDLAAQVVALAGKADVAHSHVTTDITGLDAALTARQEISEKGQANGYASLDATGKVPVSLLPAALLGAVSYQGVWNANTNTPTIPAASAANKGWYYRVSVAGTTTVSGESDWQIGDWITSNGTSWDKTDNTDQVVSVAGLQGSITAAALVTALAAVTLTGVQTLTNKTLNSPTINSPTFTGIDVWAFQPIGVPIPVQKDITGVSAPPVDQAYRYILLSAGETGAGKYNNGVLGSESVTGSAPLVLATAAVTLAGSPLVGQTIRLINTERRFLRAGSTGTVENDQMQQITGEIRSGMHAAAAIGMLNTPAGAISTFGNINNAYPSPVSTSTIADGISFNSANSPNARAGTETRSKNIGVEYYMRIK